jgi:CheY-specific phosphatase CheX
MSEISSPMPGESILLEPFILATRTALGEMAGIQPVVQRIHRAQPDYGPDQISAVLELTSTCDARLFVSFSKRTARAFAERMLAGYSNELQDSLVHDCMAEIANVIGGQAKALLAGTPRQFLYSLPRVIVGHNEDDSSKQQLDFLTVDFDTELGAFSIRMSV